VEKMSDSKNTVVINVQERNALGHPVNYKELNEMIRDSMKSGFDRIILKGVMGQRYIASTASNPELRIEIHGTPGNDLGAFLNGATIEVFGNAQDVTGNTMNSGRIIIHGNAWDITGLAARGGEILIQGDSGYRVGIHMKEFEDTRPRLIIGGKVNDYLGEYMAGGNIVVLGNGLEEGTSPVGLYIGAGMHGGRIYVHGPVEEFQLGPGATLGELGEEDIEELNEMLKSYEEAFELEVERDYENYVKIFPTDSRPFRGYYDPTLI
jgi:glutamate synthase domain-containing protein 3